MKCPVCDSKELVAFVTIRKVLELTQRGGSVKVGGVKVSQVDIKNVWDLNQGTKKPRTIKGPIQCVECGSDLFYVTGAKNNPLMGHYDLAKRIEKEEGIEYFLEGGTTNDFLEEARKEEDDDDDDEWEDDDE